MTDVDTENASIDLATLRGLLGGDGRDRAYVDAITRMEWARTSDEERRSELRDLHDAVRVAANERHAGVRSRIASGALRGRALREHFDEIAMLERDHYVEEVLGIAYPPLDEPALERELVSYSPSGYDEIVHALDMVRLEPGDRFFDIGSGTGKAVMLAALLCDAQGSGIDCNGALIDLARSASAALGIESASFVHGDARETPFDDADVFFMYLPFTGRALATVMARLLERARLDTPRTRRRFLCAGAVDLGRYGDLVLVGSPASWLHVYGWRSEVEQPLLKV
jgi:SAM-dependent methyltransferase